MHDKTADEPNPPDDPFDDLPPCSTDPACAPASPSPPGPTPPDAATFPLRKGFLCASSVPEATGVDWIAPGHLAAGKPHLLAGDGGLGKTTLALDIAARLTAGQPALPGAEIRNPMRVLVVCLEDGVRDTLLPRLRAAGADLDRVALFDNAEDAIGLPSGMGRLADQVRAAGIGFLLLDPFSGLIDDGLSLAKQEDVRKALQPLTALGASAGVTTVVIHHLNKSVGASAVHRVSGSPGITAAVRIVHLVDKHPNDPDERVLAGIKNNLAPSPASLRFRLVPTEHGAARVEHLGACDLTGDDLVGPAAESIPSRVEEADGFLRRALEAAGGAMPSAVLEEQARAAGISETTLKRARNAGGYGARRTAEGSWEVVAPPGRP